MTREEIMLAQIKRDCLGLDLIKLKETAFHRTNDLEFDVTLSRGGALPQGSGLELLKAIGREQSAV